MTKRPSKSDERYIAAFGAGLTVGMEAALQAHKHLYGDARQSEFAAAMTSALEELRAKP